MRTRLHGRLCKRLRTGAVAGAVVALAATVGVLALPAGAQRSEGRPATPAPRESSDVAVLFRDGAAGREVDPQLRRCPPVRRLPRSEERLPRAAGGCELSASGELDLKVLSAVDEFVLSRCVVGFTLRVDGHGRALVHEMSTAGVRPCNDISACFATGFLAPAWDGALERGRTGPVVRLDACLDTCVGRFRGALTLPLRRERGRLWLDATGASVGASGLTFDGRFLVRPQRPIELRGQR